MKMNALQARRLLWAGVLAMIVTACSREEAKAPAGQVVAKVDDTELTVYQLDDTLQRLPPMSPDELEKKKGEIIKLLVERQVSSNKALKLGLDRKPEGLLRLDAARRNALSQFYFTDYTSQLPKPTPVEAQKFYRDHPAMYAERREYTLLQLSVPSPTEAMRSRLDAALASGKPLEEIAASLRAEAAVHSLVMGAKASDEVDPVIAALLGKGEIGSISKDPTDTENWTAVEIVRFKAGSVELAQAEPVIMGRLNIERNKQSMADQLARLVQLAKIEYVGEYAKYAPGQDTAPAAESNVKAE